MAVNSEKESPSFEDGYVSIETLNEKQSSTSSPPLQHEQNEPSSSPLVSSSNVTEDYCLDNSQLVVKPNKEDDNTRQVGAGVVAAVVASPLVGPVLATVAGVAAAYGTTKSGAAGEVCRAAGDVAVIAKDKARDLNQRHHIVDRTTRGAQGVLVKVQHINGRYEIMEKIKMILAGTFRHLGEAFQFASKKLKKRRDDKRAEWNDGYEDFQK